MTADRVLLVVAFTVITLWLVALTLGQHQARQRSGDPVYRRLPDGRLAFRWSVHTAYQSTRRRADQPEGDRDART